MAGENGRVRAEKKRRTRRNGFQQNCGTHCQNRRFQSVQQGLKEGGPTADAAEIRGA